MLDDIYLFIKLVEYGSFANACRKLNLYQSKLSRRIDSLEQDLNLKLIDRAVKSQITLTESGKLILEQFRSDFEKIQGNLNSLEQTISSIHGELSVVMPPLMSDKFIGGSLADLLDKHPRLKLNLYYAVRDVSFFDQEFDVAISTVRPSNPKFIVKTLFKTQAGLYAAPSYIAKHGTPKTLSDLLNHRVMMPLINGVILLNWMVTDPRGEIETLSFDSFSLVFDSAVAGRNLTLSGVGISPLSSILVEDYVKNNELVPILEDYTFGILDFYLIKPNNIFNPKVNLFVDFFVSCLPESILV